VLFAPLFDLLPNVELSVEFAVPAEPAVAVSSVPEALPASVAVLALVPARVALADLVLLAVLAAVAPLMLEAVLLAARVAFRLWLALELDVAELVLEEVLVLVELLEAL
jgi:hypothetical protein